MNDRLFLSNPAFFFFGISHGRLVDLTMADGGLCVDASAHVCLCGSSLPYISYYILCNLTGPLSASKLVLVYL